MISPQDLIGSKLLVRAPECSVGLGAKVVAISFDFEVREITSTLARLKGQRCKGVTQMSNDQDRWHSIHEGFNSLIDRLGEIRGFLSSLNTKCLELASKFASLVSYPLDDPKRQNEVEKIEIEISQLKSDLTNRLRQSLESYQQSRFLPIWPGFRNIQFEDVRIHFLDEDTIEIKWKDLIEKRSCVDLGFAFKKNEERKIKEWDTLMCFAVGSGELPKGGDHNKSVQLLKKDLKSIFDTSDAPFPPYLRYEEGRWVKSYKANFLITASEELVRKYSEDVRIRSTTSIPIEEIADPQSDF